MVNETSEAIVGTFDNIEYSRANVSLVDNIIYTVNCNGIQEGDYFLRLITGCNTDAEYYLGNMETDEIDISKSVFNDVLFNGLTAPASFSLGQNFPNPFNPVTTINYSIPEVSTGVRHVLLKVYDILGREMVTLVNDNKKSGTYSVQFNASNFASGVYIYRIEAGDFVASKKMTLVK